MSSDKCLVVKTSREHKPFMFVLKIPDKQFPPNCHTIPEFQRQQFRIPLNPDLRNVSGGHSRATRMLCAVLQMGLRRIRKPERGNVISSVVQLDFPNKIQGDMMRVSVYQQPSNQPTKQARKCLPNKRKNCMHHQTPYPSFSTKYLDTTRVGGG